MPDARFYASSGRLPLGAVADLIGAQLFSDDPRRSVAAVAPLRRAGSEMISFFADPRYLEDLRTTRAGAVLIAAAHQDQAPATCARLVCASPLVAYARLAARMHPLRVHENAAPAIHPECQLGADVRLGPGVVIGPGAQIGAGTVVGANAVIGPGVAIGQRSRLGPNVSVTCALIGDDVTILAGAVIGEAGFGVASGADALIDVPQLGRVILQDGVTVGANACIDRGAWDDTLVGEHTKIDNLVQIAHNVQLGRNCALAAHTGVSGSVTVGDGVRFGGRAGVVDHVRIGPGAQVGAAAAVTKDIPAGEVWGGLPARPMRRWLYELAWTSRRAAARRA